MAEYYVTFGDGDVSSAPDQVAVPVGRTIDAAGDAGAVTIARQLVEDGKHGSNTWVALYDAEGRRYWALPTSQIATKA
jgi:hypothetical protein